MTRFIPSILMVVPFLSACGGSLPEPTQKMSDAQAAERSARELGANEVPSAQLSLKLAQEQIAHARKAIADGDNERAGALLVRAKADAELAIASAREKSAGDDRQEAVKDSAEQKSTNQQQGAVK